jgi:hypothetical protein
MLDKLHQSVIKNQIKISLFKAASSLFKLQKKSSNLSYKQTISFTFGFWSPTDVTKGA